MSRLSHAGVTASQIHYFPPKASLYSPRKTIYIRAITHKQLTAACPTYLVRAIDEVLYLVNDSIEEQSLIHYKHVG